MKLINPSFEIYDQKPGLEGIYEAIEHAGRTCYKSTRPEGQTAKDFVDRMIASKHTAMLEHGTVYLTIPVDWTVYNKHSDYKHEIDFFLNNNYTSCKDYKDTLYVTTNYRVIIENNKTSYLSYLCNPTEYHEKRYTVKFICDRGVSHEFVRHRVFSFAQESTRYCNYAKDKFNNELTFIIPSWLDKYSKDKLDDTGHRSDGTTDMFIAEELESEFRDVEARYLAMLTAGCLPQEARQVLPNAIKTELVMTGFISDWAHFFDLRAIGTTGAPHPDAKALAEPLMEEFYKRDYLK